MNPFCSSWDNFKTCLHDIFIKCIKPVVAEGVRKLLRLLTADMMVQQVVLKEYVPGEGEQSNAAERRFELYKKIIELYGDDKSHSDMINDVKKRIERLEHFLDLSNKRDVD